MSFNTGAVLSEFMGSLFLTGSGFLVSGDVFGALALGVVYAGARHAFTKSRGHFNPSVSIGELVAGKMTPMDFGQYFVGQFLGSLLGGIIMAQVAKKHLEAGNQVHPVVNGDYSNFEALIVEILFTFLFVYIASSCARASSDNLLTGVALFATLTAAGGVSGGSLNLTDTLGKYIGSSTAGDLPFDVKYDDIWVYIVGPFVGGALAGLYTKVDAMFEDAETTPLKSENPSV